MAYEIDRGRPPGEVPPLLDQNHIPGQGPGVARAMLAGAPARELPENDMINNADGVRESHEQLGLAGLRPLQDMIDWDDDADQDENMIPLDQEQHHQASQNNRRQIGHAQGARQVFCRQLMTSP